MNRFSHADILAELVDLGKDLTAAMRQELVYYRASVYKDETAERIRAQVQNLRMITDIANDPILIDAFGDHDEMLALGAQLYIPGECVFSKRTTQLLSALDIRFMAMERRLSQDRESLTQKGLREKVQYKRREILSMCRHGSRHWSFFQTL